MKKILLPLLPFLLFPAASASPAGNFASYEECLAATVQTADDTMPAARIRQACVAYQPGAADTARPASAEPAAGLETGEKLPAVSRRLSQEAKTLDSLFTITPHRPNYILLGSYNNNRNGEGLELEDSEIDPTEIKFQLSFKVPLIKDLLGEDNGGLFAAYTMRSFWQAYNSDISSPFRETNHEPEIFLSLPGRLTLFGWHNPFVLAGFSHQSNGRGGERSRSWNRLYLDFLFERGDFALSFKPWYRLPEDSKAFPGDPGGDDNPDISSYLGYGELTGAWSNGEHTVSLMLRNNLRSSHNRGAVELGWSFPLGATRPLKGYIQYFNGYGESLIDYNSSVNRIGFGLLLTDWL
jgi:phospholipase A1